MAVKAVLFLLAIHLITTTSALNILMLATLQSQSHYIVGNAITNLLLERGHHVYELTIRPPATLHPNRTSFVVKVELPNGFDTPSELSSRSNAQALKLMADWSAYSCKLVLDTDAARDLLALARDFQKRPHIDVVVHDYVTQQCVGPFAKEFGNAPVVATTMYGNTVEMDEVLGGPIFPGFIPHDVVIHPHYDQPLGWLKRIENKWTYLVDQFNRYYQQYPNMDASSKRFFGDHAPTIEEYRRNVAVALVNSHPLIQGARPQLPSVIQIGGVHVSPAKELPKGEMKVFLDGAKDGFILMSFGSIVPVSQMESWRRQSLLRAIKRLRPLKILLKWESDWNEAEYGPLPDNIFISPWVPQIDVLGHPNIRLFVTHCGGLSAIEVIARAVPVVGIPFMYDHFINAHKLAALKAGVVIHFEDLNEDTFYKAVRTVIDDEQYKNAMRKLSSLYFDQPETPQERAIFWIEFVARHKGAPHLRSPGELMSWMSRWMIDDIIIIFVITISIYIIRRSCSASALKSRPKQTKSKKT